MKKKNTIAALLVVIVAVGTFGTTAITVIQSAQAFVDPESDPAAPKAPMAASQDGNNVYVVWWTNRSGNWEVMFRASNDGGQTFGPLINLGTNGIIATTNTTATVLE